MAKGGAVDIEITSTTNNLVKETAKLAQKKYRNESKLFLLEGQKAVEEAFALNINFENVFILKEKAETTRKKCAIVPWQID